MAGKQIKKCFNCGATPLFWSKQNGSFRLVDPAGTIHNCNRAAVAAPAGDIGGMPAMEAIAKGDAQDAQEQGGNGEGQQDQGQGQGQQDQSQDPPKDDNDPDLYKLVRPYVHRDIKSAVQASKQAQQGAQQAQAGAAQAQAAAQQAKQQLEAAAQAIANHAREQHEQMKRDMAAQMLKELENRAPKVVNHKVVIKDADGEVIERIDGQHKQMARLLKYLSVGLNVMLVGPAGSGKTHAAHQAALALKLAYYPQSVGPQTSKSDLIGYMDAHGKLVRTVLREAYEHGGIYLLDEIDAGNPGVLTVLNALLANTVCSFPDGVVTKHSNFRVVAAANTYGQGASRQYVGRQQLDAATLDRFVGIDWEYDTDLETALSKGQAEWRDYVWALRKVAEELSLRCVFGTRKIMHGVSLLSAGTSRTETETATVWFGVSVDDKTKLQAGLKAAKAGK